MAVLTRKAQFYPHHGVYAYTLRGFDLRVVPRLRRLHLREQDILWIRKIYFYHQSLQKYFDADGYYRRNLYELSRRMKNDRRMPLYFLLIRSRLFDVGFDSVTHQVLWIWSPAARRVFPDLFNSKLFL